MWKTSKGEDIFLYGTIWKNNFSDFRWSPYHLDLPVDIPLFHVAEAPGLDCVSSVGVHPDQAIIGDSDQLFFFSSLESEDQKREQRVTV